MATRRKRIGLQASRLEYGYGVRIWQEAMAFAEKIDADLIVFPGRNLEVPHGFDYQYNRIFGLMNEENLDALVLITTLVCNYVDAAEISKFCARFKGIPLVSIGMELPEAPSIVIDNRAGVRDLIRHLAAKHGARRIAFVRGPVNNWEAEERFAAYRLELEAQGIAFDPKLVAQGDFTGFSSGPAIEGYFRNNVEAPDAFVFANDEMAIRSMQILRERGLRIPARTAITGFDDIAEAEAQMIPLTTVRQPLEEMARRAMRMAMDMLDGKDAPRLTVLPTEAVIRSSCGCLVRCIDSIDDVESRAGSATGSERKCCADAAMSALRGLKPGKVSALEERSGRIGEAAEAMLAIAEGKEGRDRFFLGFVESLQEEIQAGLDPGEWQLILPAICCAIEGMPGGKADLRELASLYRRCAALASEMAAIKSGASRFVASSESNILQDVQFNLSSIMHIEELVASLRSQLPRLGIGTFVLSQYQQEWRHDPRTPWEIPRLSRYVGGLEDGAKRRAPDEDSELYPSGLLLPPGALDAGKRRTLAVFPLFLRENHYGTIVYELTRLNGYVYEILTTQISGILKSISLYHSKEQAEERLRQAMMELESYNKQLSDLSLTDELTGLYNRRGFMKLAIQQLSLTRQMGKHALLVFGDIDGLKGINDAYGHDEGDEAIKATASAFRRAFRSMDIIARLGGDEFTIFAANAAEDSLKSFEARMTALLAEANEASGKPYKLSISLGCVACSPGESTRFDDYLRQADAQLYLQKKAKREARQRG